MTMIIIHPENRVPEHYRVLEALSEGAETPKLGICFAVIDNEEHLSPSVRLAIARWNFKGYVSIFQNEGHVCVILTGKTIINAHTSRSRLELSCFETGFKDLTRGLYAFLRTIHKA